MKSIPKCRNKRKSIIFGKYYLQFSHAICNFNNVMFNSYCELTRNYETILNFFQTVNFKINHFSHAVILHFRNDFDLVVFLQVITNIYLA